MLRRYIFAGVTILSFGHGIVEGMSDDKTLVATLNTSGGILIKDGEDRFCVLNPLILKNSETLRQFMDIPGFYINFAEIGKTWLKQDLLDLLARAIMLKDDRSFWQSLSIDDLFALYKADDYLHIECISRPLIKQLKIRNPKAFHRGGFLTRNHEYDSTLVQHLRNRSVSELVRSKVSLLSGQTIDLSSKNLISLKGLEKLPLSARLQCTTLNLSNNTIGTLNLDRVFACLPRLKILRAENAGITRLKGTHALPAKIIMLLPHNAINTIDDALIEGSHSCILNVASNELTPALLERITMVAARPTRLHTLKEKLRPYIVHPYTTVGIIITGFFVTVLIATDLTMRFILIPAWDLAARFEDPLLLKLYEHTQSRNLLRLGLIGKAAINIYIGYCAGAKIAVPAAIAAYPRIYNNLVFPHLSRLFHWAQIPFIPSLLLGDGQNWSGSINKRHVQAAAAKIAAVAKKRADGGLEVLLAVAPSYVFKKYI